MRSATALLLLVPLAGIAQAPTFWTPELSLQVQNVTAVTPSPDGRMVAWVQIRNVVEPERSEQQPQVWLSNADGSHRIQLTRGDRGASNPSFGPDGRSVYFTSARTGKNQVYRIPVGGGEGEAITDFKGSVSNFEISPDGKWVAFSGYEPPADLEKARKEKRDFKVVDAEPENRALYTVPAETDADGKRAQKKLFENKFDVGTFRWSPDGKTIAFDHQPTISTNDWGQGRHFGSRSRIRQSDQHRRD